MNKIEIFDPALRSAIGNSENDSNHEFLRIATIANTLNKKGFTVLRYGLASDPDVFAGNIKVNEYLMKDEVDSFPITLVDGKVVKTQQYPTDDEFAQWTGLQIEELKTVPVVEKINCGCENGECY